MTAATVDLEQQVHLITGATSGIGLETARALACQGATVVVAGRDEQKARRVVADLRRDTGSARVDYLLADLTIQAEVRRMADQFRARYQRLDVLVNNAGGFFWRRRETADGVEKTFALNYLAPFLLTNLLLDLLRAGAPARIVNVSSVMHRSAVLDLDDLQLERGYNSPKAYARSKLALILFTYELARRLEGTGVVANALHPGFVATGIGLKSPLDKILKPVMRLFAVSTKEGARTSVYLASSPQVAGVTGEYFKRERPARSSPASYDEELARRLWEISAPMAGLDREESR